MATATIFGDPTDGRIQSLNTTYLTARSGGTLTVASSGGGIARQSGQEFATPNYNVFEMFHGFDTGSVIGGAGGSCSAATYSLWCFGTQLAGSSAGILRLRLFDWGTTLTTADFVAGASLSANTLLAHLAHSSFTASAYNALTDDAAAANISLTGFTRVVHSSDRVEAGTTPTGVEYVNIYLADNSGTTNDPKVDITYVAAPPSLDPFGMSGFFGI